jgi:uncharacterized protein YndB with AHSA1/START domain
MNMIKWALALALTTNLAMALTAANTSFVFAHEAKGVESSLIINASPQSVFEHIQSSRTMEPARRKLVSHEGNVAVIEENFEDVPFIGKVKCTYQEVETPGKRVEYKMITSDKFRSFEGVWDLTPTGDGETLVKLHALTESKINVPFASAIGNPSALRDVQRRLKNLKTWTEKDNSCKSHNEANKTTNSSI